MHVFALADQLTIDVLQIFPIPGEWRDSPSEREAGDARCDTEDRHRPDTGSASSSQQTGGKLRQTKVHTLNIL